MEIRLIDNFGVAMGRLNLILMLCRRRIERSEMKKALTFLVTAFVIAFIIAKLKTCCERSSQLRKKEKRFYPLLLKYASLISRSLEVNGIPTLLLYAISNISRSYSPGPHRF
jgi:hypothetical protein